MLSVGTVEPRKNLPTLVEAFSDLARAGLDLVLVGPDGWHEDLQAVVEPLGERARPLGFVAEGELATLYAGAAAFAYPSSWEGFGLPVLEAMAYGAPVVTSAGTACAEVAGDAALLVDPKDPERAADGVEPPDRGLRARRPAPPRRPAAGEPLHVGTHRRADRGRVPRSPRG